MRIDIESWEKLNHRLSTAETSPPIAVYLLVHTLTGGADIDHSHAESKSQGSSTVWRNWVMTESLFVYTEVEFAAADYDREAENNASRGNPSDHYVEPTVRQAWVRPLAGVTSLHVGSVGQLSGFRGDWYPIDGLILTFADGSKVSLPGQTDAPNYDRDRSDQFLAVVRSQIS
jgi:hypothetical protein